MTQWKIRRVNKKDINRIDGFLDGFKHIWKDNYDLRFSQIVLNLYNYIYKKI